jgi:hypothetical protein
MKTCLLFCAFMVCAAGVGVSSANAQNIDPKSVADLVRNGAIKFTSKGTITVWLDEHQSYSISPVAAGEKNHVFRPISEEVTALMTGPGGGKPPPPPPPPKPPRPVNHGGPKPPMPIPPGPHNSKPPKPQPRPPKPRAMVNAEGEKASGSLLQQLAEEGVVVGKLETEGVSQSNWKLAKGAYTIILTTSDGTAVAALVNAAGEFVITFDNVFFASGG